MSQQPRDGNGQIAHSSRPSQQLLNVAAAVSGSAARSATQLVKRWRRAANGNRAGFPLHAMTDGPVQPSQEPGAIVREGSLVRLRRHTPANRGAFQRWYADAEIATLLRHDLRPLNDRQSRGYFDTIILPLSSRGYCFAIHDRETDELIGTTALTDPDDAAPNAKLFRIVIGEKQFWNRGYGTESTRLVVDEAFETLGLDEVRLEVFAHNPRAISVYEHVGFSRTGEHMEWLGPDRPRLHVFEMSLKRALPAEGAAGENEPQSQSESAPISEVTPVD